MEKYAVIKKNLPLDPIRIDIFGKTPSYDPYISLIQTIEHASVFNKINSEITWIEDIINRHDKLDFANFDA